MSASPEHRSHGRLVDVRSGDLQIRLAETAEEVDAALSLRYRVFYEEMRAKPSAEVAARRQDFDVFDALCDHLLVIDRTVGRGAAGVVGTYRLIRRAAAQKAGHFYSEDEYDVSMIAAHPGEVLELGRSCIDRGHRNRATMTCLWNGIAHYVLATDVDIMFGCASIPGTTDPKELALPLSFLYHNHLAPEDLRPRALPERYVDMNLMPAEEVNGRAAVRMLPPLIKGYLRLNGWVGDGAVIDFDFNTVDVCVVVKTEEVASKYLRHYTRPRGPGGD